MKILIVGDSFSADWTVKYPKSKGWVNHLAGITEVVNLSQAGCSEYKILQQLYDGLQHFPDYVIVSHTSPYRLFVESHPVHSGDVLHGDADLIYSDIKEASKTRPELEPLVQYFENFVSLDYQIGIYDLILEKIDTILGFSSHVHITHLDWESKHKFQHFLDFSSLWKKNKGTMNHYNEHGNLEILKVLNKRLDI